MAKTAERLEQVNISLPPALLAFVQETAAREGRTVSGQIRHLVTKAARRAHVTSEALAAGSTAACC